MGFPAEHHVRKALLYASRFAKDPDGIISVEDFTFNQLPEVLIESKLLVPAFMHRGFVLRGYRDGSLFLKA